LPMYPAVYFSSSQIQSLRYGQLVAMPENMDIQGLCRVYDDNDIFHGMGEGRRILDDEALVEQSVVAPKRIMIFSE